MNMGINVAAIAVWLLSISALAAAQSSKGCATPGGEVFVVQLEGNLSPELKLSASVAAGLINKHMQASTVFTLSLPSDHLWVASAKLEEPTLTNCTWTEITVVELWQLAYSSGAANSTILYDPSETWGLATVVTLCGVHQALPVAASQHRHTPQAGLRESVQAALAALQQYGLSWMAHLKASAFPSNSKHAASPELHKVVMDTRGMWADSLQATTWAYKNLFTACKQTHAMIAIQTPELMQQGLLADFIVARQLFAFWLPDLCQHGSPAHALFLKITQPAWQQHSLLSVIGYFAAQEEIAACSRHHTELALVSDWSPNLSFWSQMDPVTALLQGPLLPVPPYSPNCTYVAITASDGDSLQMNYNNMRVMMDERASLCSQASSVCPPFSWTISSRLATMAPFVLQWHYRQAVSRAGRDSFLMGPSGFGFLHPTAIAVGDPLRRAMINLTAAAAAQLDMTAYVHWDEYDNADLVKDGNRSHSAACADRGVLKKRLDMNMSAGDDASLLESQCQDAQQRSADAGVGTVQEDSLLYNNRADLGRVAMQQYIAEFQNTSIQAVFSPITPYVHRHVGSISTFRELIRWTGSQTESPSTIADMLLHLPKGTLGYVYKLPDITMQEVEALGNNLQHTHVKLVGHRELVLLAADASSDPSQA